MHHSLIGAGRATHLKVAAFSLAGAIVVVLVGLSARPADSASSHAKTSGAVVKAGVPAAFAGHKTSSTR